jgi:hypothetical protein
LLDAQLDEILAVDAFSPLGEVHEPFEAASEHTQGGVSCMYNCPLRDDIAQFSSNQFPHWPCGTCFLASMSRSPAAIA